MPIYVTRIVTGPDGEPRTLADRDTLATLTGYAATTIRLYCTPEQEDPDTGRALYHQATIVAALEARNCYPRPYLQTPRARRDGPAKRRRKP